MNVDVIVAPSSTFVEAARKPPRQFPSFSLSTLTRLGLDMRQVSLDQAGMPLDYQCSSLSLRPKNWK